MEHHLDWSSDNEFTLDGVSYLSTFILTPETNAAQSPGQMFLIKPRSQVEHYVAMIEAIQPRFILELGIYKGGSTALLAQLAKPEKLVAIELRDSCRPLDKFIRTHSLEEVIVPIYGVNQSDVVALDTIVQREFDGHPIDLIIDDASHLLAETKASFNRLFPHLRPGGLYVIEDWAWSVNPWGMPLPARLQGTSPLSSFITELVFASACLPRCIAEITIDAHKAIVRRGTRNMDPAVFDVSAHFDPISRQMVDALSPFVTATD
ncbi:MAG: class I SAM-dependent methyltransferase [Acidimicrobiia bacterium]|nr:class I SAM-dependent methyltransferase [Acidimicrobiia bacterium]